MKKKKDIFYSWFFFLAVFLGLQKNFWPYNFVLHLDKSRENTCFFSK